MKKTMLVFVAGVISASILPGHLFAQDIKNQNGLVISNSKPAKAEAASLNPAADNTASVTMINAKAIKDFKNRYSGVKDEKWYTLGRGFISYFTEDGFQDRVFYDKKGHWEASIRCCNESKLPRDVRAQVKRNYYDFTITVVQIVEVPDHLVYLVHLEDEKNIKIIRVTDDGDMDVYQEFTKS